jgi:hypothetical protein
MSLFPLLARRAPKADVPSWTIMEALVVVPLVGVGATLLAGFIPAPDWVQRAIGLTAALVLVPAYVKGLRGAPKA